MKKKKNKNKSFISFVAISRFIYINLVVDSCCCIGLLISLFVYLNKMDDFNFIIALSYYDIDIKSLFKYIYICDVTSIFYFLLHKKKTISKIKYNFNIKYN